MSLRFAKDAAFERLHPRDPDGQFKSENPLAGLDGTDIRSMFARAFEPHILNSERRHHDEFDAVRLTPDERRESGIDPAYFSVTDPEKQMSRGGVAGLLDYQAPSSYSEIQGALRGADPKMKKEADAFVADIRKRGKSQRGRTLWRTMDFDRSHHDWRGLLERREPFAAKSPQLLSLGEDRGTAENIGWQTHSLPATFRVHVEADTPALDTAAWWNGRQAPEVIYPPGATLEYRGEPPWRGTHGGPVYDLYLT